jgi:hypothetical protein
VRKSTGDFPNWRNFFPNFENMFRFVPLRIHILGRLSPGTAAFFETRFMGLDVRCGSYRGFCEGMDRQEMRAETRLNLMALHYGYKYRLDILPPGGLSRVEFVRTLREARFVGMPIRRSKGSVRFFKLRGDGTLQRHQW